MSESHIQRADTIELTADQIQARVLHRDGLMLVIDKPAGLPVHRGPKGGANLESSFDALRFGLPRPPGLPPSRPRRCWPTGSTRIPPAASFWDATARLPRRLGCCSSMARST